MTRMNTVQYCRAKVSTTWSIASTTGAKNDNMCEWCKATAGRQTACPIPKTLMSLEVTFRKENVDEVSSRGCRAGQAAGGVRPHTYAVKRRDMGRQVGLVEQTSDRRAEQSAGQEVCAL